MPGSSGKGAALGFVLAAITIPTVTSAQEASDGVVDLDTVTVTADGVGSATNAPAAVTVIERPELERQVQPESIGQMISIIPGVTVSTQADSPQTSINIRGLQDFGRVNVTVDGARQNYQVSGHGANGGFFLDPEMVQQVEINRGTGSAIDGTGSIGGGAAFTTLDADSVLRPDQTFGGRLKTRYSTNNPQLMEHGAVAGRVGDAFDVIAAGTWNKQSRYLDGRGSVVPQSGDDMLSGLVKARVRPAEGQEISLSALMLHDDYRVGNFSSTIKDTTTDANTFTLGYNWDSPDNELIDLRSNLFYTTTRTDQVIGKDKNDRNPGHISRVGESRFFEIGTLGGDVRNTSRFDTGPIAHAVTYGTNFYYDDVKTGGFDADNTAPGTRFVYGAFVEDTMTYGAFSLTPAVRFDSFDLKSGKLENEGSAISPKITGAVTPWDPITIFASYSEGFRPPSITESLVEAVHPGAATFSFVPNPNLKGEEAHELQIGTNIRFDDVLREGDKFRFKAAAYRNIVDNYIELQPFIDPINYPYGAYQYQNIAQARLWGYEVEAMYDAGIMFLGIGGSYVRGVDNKTGERLALIPGSRVFGTIGGRMLDQKLEMGTRVSWTGPVDDPPPSSPYLATKAYTLVDVFASAQVTENFSVALNIDNLFNEYYVQYLNNYASPGRNAKFTGTLRF